MKISMALVQMHAGEGAASNLDAIVRFAAQAKEAGCAAVCFPEASLTGYAPERAGEFALDAQSAPLRRLQAEAAALQIDLLVGYMEARGGAYHLTHSLLRPDGTRHDYRKTHLGEKEARYFLPGDSLDVFALSCGLKAGFQLCVETHFPEVTQTLSLRGAQVVFAPHAVPHDPQKRRRLWQTYIPARAYDNRVYVACCNLWDGERFGGGCFAAEATGEVILDRFESKPSLAVFDVDPARLDALRSSRDGARARYYPARRRPELYL